MTIRKKQTRLTSFASKLRRTKSELSERFVIGFRKTFGDCSPGNARSAANVGRQYQ